MTCVTAFEQRLLCPASGVRVAAQEQGMQIGSVQMLIDAHAGELCDNVQPLVF